LKTILAHSKVIDFYLSGFSVPRSYPGDKKDLRQVGLLGLAKAHATHDSTKSSFNTWAWYWVRAYIRDEVKRFKKKTDIMIIIDSHDPTLSMENRIALKNLTSDLEGRDLELITRYIAGQTFTDIGREWNVSRQAVTDRYKKILRKMK